MKKSKPLRYRIKDVGKPGGHYLLVKAWAKAGPRGGHTTGELITETKLKTMLGKARKKKKK